MSDIPYLLKFRPFNDSSIFEFKDPDSGRTLTAPTRPELIKLIVQYRLQNGYEDIENLPLVLDNYLCHLPQNEGKCAPYFPFSRGLLATLKGGIALVTSMMYKSFVSQDVADSRAAICVKCPHNIFLDKTQFIGWSDKIAEASIGKRRSIHHDALGNCAVCSCPLRAKVFYDGDMNLTEEQISEMNKVNCWQPKS